MEHLTFRSKINEHLRKIIKEEFDLDDCDVEYSEDIVDYYYLSNYRYQLVAELIYHNLPSEELIKLMNSTIKKTEL